MSRVKITSERRTFGRQCKFTDSQAQLLCLIPSRPHLEETTVPKDVRTVEYSTVPSYSMTSVNTIALHIKSQGMTHSEGGYSAEVDIHSIEQTSRIRKRFTKDPTYTSTLTQRASVVDYICNNNNVIDIYEEYFGNDQAGMTQAHLAIHELALLRDPTASRASSGSHTRSRSVSDLQWSPTQTNLVATAYSNLNNMHRTSTEHLQSFIWDIRRSNAPVSELLPSSPIRCLAYGIDGRFLLGGTVTGIVSIFDPRAGAHAAKSSNIEHSHNDPVCELTWLQSKSGTECASVSTDGNLFYWDTRKLDKPTEVLRLHCPTPNTGAPKHTSTLAGGGWSNRAIATSSGQLYAGLQLTGRSMEYHVASGHQKLLVGTEQGIVLMCSTTRSSNAAGGSSGGTGGTGSVGGNGQDQQQDMSGNNMSNNSNGGGTDAINSSGGSAIDSRISQAFMGHLSSVCTVERHPMFPRYFLTSGDWTARIWSERSPSELLSTPHHRSTVIGSCWSPTRPALFYSATSEGQLHVWDLLLHQDRPSLVYDIGTDVSTLRARPDGTVLSVGGHDGSIALLECSSGLSRPQSHEKSTMNQLLERLQSVATSRSRRKRMETGRETRRNTAMSGRTGGERDNKENRVRSLVGSQDAREVEHEVDCAFFEAVQ